MDALYFRVSSDRQTTENQFDELIAGRARRRSRPGLEPDPLAAASIRSSVSTVQPQKKPRLAIQPVRSSFHLFLGEHL
jgi:hypothetical protein